MDTVRFGRALGFGARQAAKTLVAAADAATAAKPPGKSAGANNGQTQRGAEAGARATAPVSQGTAAVRPAPVAVARQAAKSAARTVAGARGVQSGLTRGGKRFGEAVWGPFVRLSGVLWLEVSGVFFGIFALFALVYLWKSRGAWHSGGSNPAGHRSLLGAVVMLALFGYFCVSNFVRARQRERGR